MLRLAVTISGILLCVLAFQWTLIDRFTPFLVFPLLNAADSYSYDDLVTRLFD